MSSSSRWRSSFPLPSEPRRRLLRIPDRVNQVLEWNQIFIDTLIATNTANSSSQRLGAIVHTAIFDAYNGIQAALHTNLRAQYGRPRRVAPSCSRCCGLHRVGRPVPVPTGGAGCQLCGIARGTERALRNGRPVGQTTAFVRRHASSVALPGEPRWRNPCSLGAPTDGFGASYPAFNGGTAVGQWRPTPPAFGPMSAQGLAFTEMFVLVNNTQFDPGPPRVLNSATYTDDFNAVKTLGRRSGSTRTDDQTALAPFWEGNATVHWNQAANQIARSKHLSMSDSNRLLAVLNIAMADTAFTTWGGKRFYGSVPSEVTWRPVTSIPLADTDGNPDTAADPDWLPLINTPSHPEYPAGHPSLNGAAATVLLSHFGRRQTFTLTTPGQPDRTYSSIAQARADGNNARVWGGMHYPSTVAISDAVGEAIAEHVNRNAMQRLHGRAK